MKKGKVHQRAKLHDFCQLAKWYPKEGASKKGGFKNIMMNYIEDPSESKPSPTREGLVPKLIDCQRGIAEDKNKRVWFATLSTDPYSEGHTIVVSQEHFNDITDTKIEKRKSGYVEFWRGVHQCAHRLKIVLGAERIYVASLCDGVEHLHVHLIPRYKEDRKKAGFGFMGERERLYNEGILHICPRSVPRKVAYLQELAKKL